MPLFTNPNIITSYADAVLGTVETKKSEVSYLEYISLVRLRLIKMVMAAVKDNMTETINYQAALQEVLHLALDYLRFDDILKAFNEEQIADKILTSQEYQFWEASIYNKFMNLHKGVVEANTPIPVSGKNDVYEDMDIEDSDYIEILESLSSVTQVQP